MHSCPNCDREWDVGCEQSICIDMHGQCITCHFRDNMPEGRTHEQAQADLAEISAKRRAQTVPNSDPTPEDIAEADFPNKPVER